ncbi:MAG TPA: DUF3352 domain-containing protein [Chloroflexia bacterium]|nr:DUF3352 domain-containing protein [Chloroflexia bacterium]
MSNNDPNKPGWRFDPETGQPINSGPPPQPQTQPGWSFDPQTGQPIPPPAPQPEQPSYPPSAPTQPYTPTPQGGYQAPLEQPGYTPQYGAPQQPQQYQQYQQPPAGPTAPYVPPQQVNVAPAKKGGRGPVIGLLVVALLLAAGGAAAFFILGRTVNRPAAAVSRVLPPNALAFLSVDPVLEGTQKAAMDQLGEAFKSQPGFDDAWAKITEQTTEMAGGGEAVENCAGGMTDFGSMSSYLGNNLTIAVLPPSSADLEGLQTGDEEIGAVLSRNVVGMVDLDFNPLNKQGPAAEFKTVTDNVSQAELVEKYRDMDIRKATVCDATLYFTLLDGSATAVLAADAAPLKVVMDQYKDDKGLKTDARFTALQAQVPAERIATLYLNWTEIYKQAGFIDPTAAEAVQGVEGAMLMTLSAENDGLRLDVASETDFTNNMLGTSMDVQLNANARPDVNTLSDIPTGSLAFLLGTDLQTILQGGIDAIRNSGGDDANAGLDDMIAQVQDRTGMDLEQDILPLMSGDWAISVFPDPAAGAFPVRGVVFQMKLKQEDMERAQQVVEALAQGATDGQSETVDVSGNTFHTLSPDGAALMGTTNDRLIVAVSANGEPADQAAADTADGLGQGIGSTDAWRDTAKHLPQNSNLIGWLDFNSIRELLEGTLEGEGLDEYETTAAPFVRPIKYLLMGSSSQAPEGDRLSRNHNIFFLGISK